MSTKQNDETQSRWYMANKDGMVTLCADQADAEQEAKDAQEVWPQMGPHRAVQLVEASQAFTAADMATAAAQGFRDGQAAQAAAGQEPVATAAHIAAMERAWLWMESQSDGQSKGGHATFDLMMLRDERDALRAAIDTAPQPVVAAEWVSVDDRLPEPGKPVLLDIGKKFPIRAMWAAKNTVEPADDDTDWAEYDEATGKHWCPEGWYEWNQHEETHWAVSETPRAWREFPPPSPSAPSTEGENNG